MCCVHEKSTFDSLQTYCQLAVVLRDKGFLAYLLVILTFATTYFIIGHKIGPVLSPLGSVVFSMTSFHGRGFFPGGITLDDPLTVVAAFEAFIGLLIEVTFIATLTRPLFGK